LHRFLRSCPISFDERVVVRVEEKEKEDINGKEARTYEGWYCG
jgi:hypothetical protein